LTKDKIENRLTAIRDIATPQKPESWFPSKNLCSLETTKKLTVYKPPHIVTKDVDVGGFAVDTCVASWWIDEGDLYKAESVFKEMEEMRLIRRS
jgi:hypothetical protein